MQNPQVSPYWIKITISAMLLLIFFSLYSIMTVQNKNSVTSSGQSATELQSFIEDYYPQSPTVYNLEEKINP